MKDIQEFFEMSEILETISEGLLFTRMDGEIVSINKAGAKLLGYGAPEELVGKNIRNRYRKEESFDQFLTLIKKTGEINNYLILAIKRDGRQAYLEAYSRVRPDREGNPAGISTIFKDVSERELGKRALEKADNRYRRLFNETTEGYVRFSETNNIIFINPAGARILGYDSPIDITSQKVLDVWADTEKRDAYLAKLRLEGRVINVPIEIVNNKGRKKTLLVSEHLVTSNDGQIIGSDALFRDITVESEQRHEIEKTFRLRRNILTQRNDPGIIFDRDGKILFVNPGFSRFFGYTSEDVVDKSLFDFIPPEDHDLIDPAEICRRAIDENLTTMDFRFRKNDGSFAALKWMLIPSHYQPADRQEATLVAKPPPE